MASTGWVEGRIHPAFFTEHSTDTDVVGRQQTAMQQHTPPGEMNCPPLGSSPGPGSGSGGLHAEVPAIFRPNALRVLHVELSGRHACVASNDMGASTYECRHFVDKDYLSTLPYGPALLAALEPPSPPCRFLLSHGDDVRDEDRSCPSLRVIGMLGEPLPVTLLTHASDAPATGAQLCRKCAGDATTTRVSEKPNGCGRLVSHHSFAVPATKRIRAELAHVLVVERLPVPLHVSVKALMEACEDDAVAADLCCMVTTIRRTVSDPTGGGRVPCGALGGALGEAFVPESFPRRYRAHEYWSSNAFRTSAHGGGSFGSSSNRVQLVQMERALMAVKRGDRVYVAGCSRCGDDGCSASGSTKRRAEPEHPEIPDTDHEDKKLRSARYSWNVNIFDG